MKINYQLYQSNGTKIYEFKSSWIFKDGEKIFILTGNKKRNFRVVRITHDIELFNSNAHIVRLYVEEGRAYE